MKYADFRPQIKSGDVLAWTHMPCHSWYDLQVQAVRMATRSEYSHVAVAWIVGGRVFALESVSAGVRIFPLSLDLPVFLVPWLPLTEEQLEFALSKIGQPYSKIEGIKALFSQNDPADQYWECAEYVCAVLGLTCLATPAAVIQTLLDGGATLRELQ